VATVSVRPKRDRSAVGAAVRAAIADQFRGHADAYYPSLIGAGMTPARLRCTPVDKLDPGRWIRRAARLDRGEPVAVQAHEIPHAWRPAGTTVEWCRIEADGTVTVLGRPEDVRPNRVTGEVDE
jgi:hypothetical protein